MKRFVLIALPFFLTAISYSQQDQQSNPPLGTQSTYPDATHKMNNKETKDTPSAKGQTVDLNSASKKETMVENRKAEWERFFAGGTVRRYA